MASDSGANSGCQMPQPLYALLERLAHGIVTYMVPAELLSYYHGGLMCPACGGVHGRGCDAVFPLAFWYRRSGQRVFYDAFRQLARFMIRTQKPGGAWDAEPMSTWDASTVFALLSLASAYRVLERELVTSSIGLEYLVTIRRAADWTVGSVDDRFANINYLFASLPALELAGRILEDERYHRKAWENAELALEHIDADGFIIGEGYRYPSEVAYPPVDIGYSADTSLGALALYDRLAEARPAGLHDALMRAARTHLNYFYPDGALDGSWGARSYKWLYFGSKTAHGSEMWTWLLAPEEPACARACRLSAGLKRRMLTGDVLDSGLHQQRTGQPACIQSTFNRADALANALAYGPTGHLPEAPLPTERIGFRRLFRSVNVYMQRSRHLMLTVSGYGYLWRDDRVQPAQPMGGAVCFLWHERFGPVQLGSQAGYYRAELTNQPRLFANLEAVSTPRLVLERDGIWSMLFEPFARLEEDADALVVKGMLRNQQLAACGAAYSIRYRLEDARLLKTFSVHGLRPGDRLRIIEPVVFPEGALVERDQAAETARVSGAAGTVRVGLRGLALDTAGTDLGFAPFPGVFFQPFAGVKTAGEAGSAEFEVIIEIE